MKKSSLIKFITILTLSSTFLSADTFSLKVAKQRDVLRDSNVTLYVNVVSKDVNSSYSYVWKEGNRTLGSTNPLKASFSKGKHYVSVEVVSKQGEKKRVSMLVKAWDYKTETITPVYFEKNHHGRVEKRVYDHRNFLLEPKVNIHSKPFKVIENRYDKQGRVVFKRVEEVVKDDENRSKGRQIIMLYSYDKNSNIIKEEKLNYINFYPVTLNDKHKIIARERAKDYDASHPHTHFITYRKYDERGNKIEERWESLRGKNIRPMAIHGATKVEYIYNENNDLVKEKAPNRCSMIKERIYSYIYSNELSVE